MASIINYQDLGIKLAHIANYTSSVALTNPPTKAEMEAELLLISNAINAILLDLEKIGVLATV